MEQRFKVTHRVASLLGTDKPAAGKASKAVSLADAQKSLSLQDGSWELGALKAAARPDGTVNAALLDQYLRAPSDLRFVTSSAMASVRAQVETTGSAPVAGIKQVWQQRLAQLADANGDKKLQADELDRFLGGVKGGTVKDIQWVPDQRASALMARVAALTGEGNAMMSATTSGVTLPKNYMDIVLDAQRRIPDLVGYTLTAADIRETPSDVKRANNFHADPASAQSADSSDYDHSGFDRGHQKPAEDSPDNAAMGESFLMTNMAPQTPQLNEMSWRLLEQGVNELVRATRGQAVIYTGSLFLDDKGQPTAPTKWLTVKGQERVAVPTHSFKTVLLTLPDGTRQAFAFIVPNRADLPAKVPDMAKFLQGCQVSVDDVERLTGANLYSGLSASAQARVEGTAHPAIQFPNAQSYKVAGLLWPQAVAPADIRGVEAQQFPFVPSLYERWGTGIKVK